MLTVRLTDVATMLCVALVARTPQAQVPKGLPLTLRNERGLQLLAVTEAAQPTLRIVLPDRATTDRALEVLVPEHVTAVKRGSGTAEHLFLPGPGSLVEQTAWHVAGRSLEYSRTLPGEVDLIVGATLENDGVRFRYEFTNRSKVSFEMIYAVTDPRLTGMFHDVRMERTYVHHANGFDLLASEVPTRLTVPLARWLPSRVLASFTWPLPAQRIDVREGITHYYKSRPVDMPLVVTRSTDQEWVVASFSRSAGNVWSNPELTCQHVDPQTSLPPQQHRALEVKMLVIHGSLDDALRLATAQRASLK